MQISRMGLMVGVLVSLTACGRDDNSAAMNEVGDTMGMGRAPLPAAIDTMGRTGSVPGVGQTELRPGVPGDTARLSDAEIAAVLIASDSAEINPSELALRKSQSAQLRECAERMITDHGVLEDSLHALLRTLKMKPAPNPLSTQVQSQARSTMWELERLSGAAFDQAYARIMLQSHEGALNAIDQRLLPAVQNAQLKAALEQKVRPTVEAHLKRIREIESATGVR